MFCYKLTLELNDIGTNAFQFRNTSGNYETYWIFLILFHDKWINYVKNTKAKSKKLKIKMLLIIK